MEDMTKMIVDTNDRSKRYLPTWMQSNNTSKNKKCEKLNGIYSTSGKQKETLDVASRIEFMSSEIDVAMVEKKDPESKDKFSKKHTRKPKRGDGSEDLTNSFVRRKRKNENIIGMTDDEAELAIEDLISIAEEFLSADEVMQSEQSVTRKSKSVKSISIPMNPSVPIEGKLNGAIISCELLSKCNQTSTFHLNTLEHNQTAESAGFSSNTTIQSRDVAQDMLELFLGPLLKNAPRRESDPDLTKNTDLNS